MAIRAQMGFGSAGATKGTTGLRTDTQRRYTTAQMDLATYPDTLRAVAERFQGVLIENRPAIYVLQQHDSANTLHFIDPPYLHATRSLGSACYRHELSDADHVALLRALCELRGMVVLCGYPNDLYAAMLSGWQMYTTQSRISGRSGTTMRTEATWINPACALNLSQQTLFQKTMAPEAVTGEQ